MFTKIKNGFLKIFGDIKLYKWPFFLIYMPKGYRVKGEDVREVIETIQPGDIVIRGFKNYLDGYFIPGIFTHAGIYLGELNENDRKDLPKLCTDAHFKQGKQMVAHAMAEGVFLEDIINFCRCDYMLILRFPKELHNNVTPESDNYHHLHYTSEERKIQKRLEANESLAFNEVFGLIKERALSQVGKPYDFDFNFTNARQFTCTEYVYYSIKALEGFHGIRPRLKKYFFFKKLILAPDDYIASSLDLVWKSASVSQKDLDAIKVSN